MIYNIPPVPKPRMTQSDKWKKRDCVLRYRLFCDEVRLRGVELPPSGASITFIMPMPESWPKRKRDEMDGKPHQQKPDLSNLIKALEDAVHLDDSHIWQYSAEKAWGERGLIVIRNEHDLPW